MKFRKRQIILASLIVALGTAVYLNWQFSDNKNLGITSVMDSSDELGEARYVNNANFSDNSNILSESTKQYFAEAQISRQKAHENEEEILTNLMSKSNLDEEIKKTITKNLENISKNITQEANIENLLKSKGFSECLAIVSDGQCNVIVTPNTINDTSIVIIKDIVSNQTSIPNNKIKIIETK